MEAVQNNNFNGLRSPLDNLILSPKSAIRGPKSPALTTSKKLNADAIAAKFKSTFDVFANPNIIITGNNNH